jgi:hypothetical protein
MRLLSVVVLLLLVLAFFAQHQRSSPLYDGEVYFLKDESTTLSINEILQQDWSSADLSPVNFGFSDAAFWFYLPLSESLARSPAQHVLEIDFPTIDALDFFLVDSAGRVIEHVRTGTDLPFSSRQLWDDDWVFPIDAGRDAVAVYLRAATSNSLQMPIRIVEREHFFAQDTVSLLLWGVLYGLMLIMALYSFLNCIVIFDKLYLYYSLYVLATMFTIASLNGHGFALLWPDVPAINSFALSVFPCLMICFGTAFALLYLGIESQRLRSRYVGYGFIAVSLFSAILALGTRIDLSFWAAVLTVAFSITLLFFGLGAVMRRHYLGWYFLVGWSGLLLGAGMFALNVLGLLPFNVITVHSKEVGSAFEIIMLSLGMAAIYNHEREERYRIDNSIMGMNQRLQRRLNLINSKSGVLEIPQLQKHLQDIRNLDRRVHQEMGRLLVVAVQVLDKVSGRPDYIAQADCLRGLFNSRVTVFPFNTQREGLQGEVTVLLFPLHNKFEAEPILERIEGWRLSLGEQYDLHFGYAISHLTEKYDVDYIDESLHYLEEAIQRHAVAYSIDDTLGFAARQQVA